MSQQNKLFLVEIKDWPLTDCEYDFFDGFIVCCQTEIDARNTHPRGGRRGNLWDADSWIKQDLTHTEALTVTFLGIADEKTKLGVVLSSFHAG